MAGLGARKRERDRSGLSQPRVDIDVTRGLGYRGRVVELTASARRSRLFLLALALLFVQVSSKAIRDAFFLSTFGSSNLPSVLSLSALLTLGSSLAIGQLMVRFGPKRVLVLLLFGAGLGFFTVALLATSWPHAGAVLLYLQVTVLGGASISTFWALVSESFDPHQIKKRVGQILSGATLGGLLGGLAVSVGADELPAAWMLGGLGVGTMLSAFSAQWFAPKVSARPELVPQARGSTWLALGRSGHARLMTAIVGLGAILASLLDYVLSAAAESTFTEPAALVTFFARFYMVSALLTFLVQITLSRRLLRRLGVAGTLAAMPISIGFTSLVGLSFFGLWVAAAARALEEVLTSSVHRSAQEILYNPLSADERRILRPFFDGWIKRGGTIVGAGLSLLALSLMGTDAPQLVLGGSIFFAGLLIWACLRIHGSYVTALADSLRKGLFRVDEDQDSLDGTTMRTLAESQVVMRRSDLLHEIERQRALEAQASRSAIELKPNLERIQARLADLYAEPPEVSSRALAELEPQLASYLLPLFRLPAWRQAHLAELGPLVRAAPGTFIDFFLGASLTAPAKVALAELLESHAPDRALHGFAAGLDAEDCELRYLSALALLRARARLPSLWSADGFRRVAEVQPDLPWIACDKDALLESEHPYLSPTERRQLGPAWELVFALLALRGEAEALHLAARALVQPDRRLLGTAIEYLEDIVGESLFRALKRDFAAGDHQRSGLDSRELRALLLDTRGAEAGSSGPQ